MRSIVGSAEEYDDARARLTQRIDLGGMARRVGHELYICDDSDAGLGRSGEKGGVACRAIRVSRGDSGEA